MSKKVTLPQGLTEEQVALNTEIDRRINTKVRERTGWQPGQSLDILHQYRLQHFEEIRAEVLDEINP